MTHKILPEKKLYSPACLEQQKNIPLFLKEKVNAACQTGILPLYHHKKQSKKMPYNACDASASCTESALHICRRQMLHTAKPCFIRSTFTLIELLVNAACKTGVLPLYHLKKQSKKMPYNACEANASCTESALHICRRQMLHTA
ncbi:MAG: hypothetical protein IKC65_01775, partial [Lentisphaeria bacterium]|nr:hypothetical protein [Lentisphaeria bacterium]